MAEVIKKRRYKDVPSTPVKLYWDTSSQVVEVLVRPTTAGIHKAQVQLWARRHQPGAVVIQAEAAFQETAGSTSDGFEMVATVEVEFTVHGRQYSIEHQQAVGKDQWHEHRHDRGFGMSL